MKRDWRCMLGFHRYEIHDTIDVFNSLGNIVERVMILRCADCGRIRTVTISVDDQRYFTNKQ